MTVQAREGEIRVEAGICEVCGSPTPDQGRLLCDGCLAHLEYHMGAATPAGAQGRLQGPFRARTPAELAELVEGEPGWVGDP